MACFQFFCFFLVTFALLMSPGNAATCRDCFLSSRAAYYMTSGDNGTETRQCGYGTLGATLNRGSLLHLISTRMEWDVVHATRCTNGHYCSNNGVTVVITDHGSSDHTDFIMSRRAFGQMAQSADAAKSLIAYGIVDIEYRRVPCSYTQKNITIKIDESSNNPHYLAFIIWYQRGMQDITAVLLCETESYTCKLLDRTYGAVWTTTSPPRGPLSLRMLLRDENGDEMWIVPINDIPKNWKPGDALNTGVQVIP